MVVELFVLPWLEELELMEFLFLCGGAGNELLILLLILSLKLNAFGGGGVFDFLVSEVPFHILLKSSLGCRDKVVGWRRVVFFICSDEVVVGSFVKGSGAWDSSFSGVVLSSMCCMNLLSSSFICLGGVITTISSMEGSFLRVSTFATLSSRSTLKVEEVGYNSKQVQLNPHHMV